MEGGVKKRTAIEMERACTKSNAPLLYRSGSLTLAISKCTLSGGCRVAMGTVGGLLSSVAAVIRKRSVAHQCRFRRSAR